jgi:hypothetical protein
VVHNVLKKSRKLKAAGGFLEKVFVKPDQTPAYRAEMRCMNEVFKREQAKPENVGHEVRPKRSM